MKKVFSIFLLTLAITLVFALPLISDARSGCCSHHGGVCGCGCCDGTPLSATCAPYYPECNSPSSNSNYNPPVNSNVVPDNTTPDVTQNQDSNSAPQTYPSTDTSNQDNSSALWVVGAVIVVGIIIYIYYKGKNKPK